MSKEFILSPAHKKKLEDLTFKLITDEDIIKISFGILVDDKFVPCVCGFIKSDETVTLAAYEFGTITHIQLEDVLAGDIVTFDKVEA